MRLKKLRKGEEWRVKTIPATLQFINWWNACNSWFSVLWVVDKYTMSEDKATKRAWG